MNIYFSSNCRHLRHIHRLRQQDVARELRISDQAYNYYEKKKGYLHHTIVTSIASFFHVSIHDLMYTDLKRDPPTMQYFLLSFDSRLVIIDSIELEAMSVRLADLRKELDLLMAPLAPVSMPDPAFPPKGRPMQAPVGRHPDPAPYHTHFNTIHNR